MERHGIGWAVDQLKDGKIVARKGWNGPNQLLFLEKGDIDEDGALLPYVMIQTVQGTQVPWLCSQTDLLAEDWELV